MGISIKMKYKDLLDKTKNYSRIIVTGPQRSGTTYCAYILAKDLGYTRYDEMSFGTGNYNEFKDLISKNNYVLQTTVFSYCLQDINTPSTLIIWMDRNNRDILESEKKINWPGFKDTKKHYMEYYPFHKDLINKFQENAPLKKFIFDNIQIHEMQAEWLKVPYSILSQTSEFKTKEERKNFLSKQIK